MRRKSMIVPVIVLVMFLLFGIVSNASVDAKNKSFTMEPTSIVYVYGDDGNVRDIYYARVIDAKADGSILIYDCENNRNVVLMNSIVQIDGL